MNHQIEWSHPLMEGLPTNGAEIEARSHGLIDKHLRPLKLPDPVRAIYRRVIHAAGDLDLADCVAVHPEAVDRGIAALRAGATVFCDVKMVCAGLTRLDNPIVCSISDQKTILFARENSSTRAAAAMALAGGLLSDSLIIVGNAPTAVWKTLELYETQKIEPALIIGTPVGFVGAAESKEALIQSGLPYITVRGHRGGSAMAAAAANALAIMARAES